VRDAAAGLLVINRLVDEGINIADFSKDIIEFFRKVLVYKVSASKEELKNLELSKDLMAEVEQLTMQITARRLVEIIEKLMAKSREARYSQIVQLPLELAVVELCTDQDDSPHDAPSKPSDPPGQPAAKKPADPPKQQQTETAKKSAIKVSVDTIRSAWSELVTAVRTHNHSAGLSLKMGHPYRIDGDQLIVAFQHKLHADRLKERSIRSIIEDAATVLFGEKLALATVVLSSEEFGKLQPASQTEDSGNLWDQAMQVFGETAAKE
jgi:DNA polymerase III gamma/tau subunit